MRVSTNRRFGHAHELELPDPVDLGPLEIRVASQWRDLQSVWRTLGEIQRDLARLAGRTDPPPPGPPAPLRIPGCVNGILADPKAYFFSLIRRQEGEPADDWAAVLAASGLPAGPAPGMKAETHIHYGVTQQLGAAGPRGVVFLPTARPDAQGYYTRQILVITAAQTAGGPRWAWIDRFPDGPPYAPHPCGSTDPHGR